jgi:hypothetical protein
MEAAFKFVFFLAVLVFCLVIIGIFLLVLKILLLFSSEIHIMGMTIS